MSKVFFISDTHFWHKKIIEFCARPFISVDEMNKKMVDNWNSVVNKGDTVYHLGDFSMGYPKKSDDLLNLFNSLNGQKVLIKGNHDDKQVLSLPWAFIKETYGLKHNGKYVWLSHYPHRSWNMSYHGSYHLYGHVHGTTMPWGWSCDVGVDSWDFTPVSFEQIDSLMKKLPRMCESAKDTFTEKGAIWNAKRYMNHGFNDFFIGDGTKDSEEWWDMQKE